VVTTLGGPDALFYDPLSLYEIFIGFLTIGIASGLNQNSLLEVGDTQTVVFSTSQPAVNGLYLTPSASGLVFNPPTVYFPPGVQFAHSSYTADITPGPTQVKFSIGGPDSSLFQLDPTLSRRIVIDYLRLSIGGIGSVIVGSTSLFVPVLSVGGDGRQLSPPNNVTVNFVVSPPGAVNIIPPNVTLGPITSSAQIQVRANIFSNFLSIQPVLSGPGAVYFQQPVSSISFSSSRRDFIINSFANFFVDPAANQLTVGVEAGPFGITARSVPTDVSLYLSAPGLQFIPSVLRFTGTFETLYFTIIPLKATQTVITFSLGGTDAPLFNVPPVSPVIRVTHHFIIPSLPSEIVGRRSSPLTVSVVSPIQSPVVLQPSAGGVNFYPPFLLFTPNVTQQTFTFLGTSTNYNLGYNINPLVIGGAYESFSTNPVFTSVSWLVREVDEPFSYLLSVPELAGTLAVNIVPATFRVTFSSLSIGEVGSVNITVTAPPRSDVVLLLVANNLNFEPAAATFSPNVTSQVLAVRIVHADFKSTQDVPYTVDYIVAGSNWEDFIPPAQTFLGVRQGGAPVVGNIGASGAVVSWGVSVAAVLASLLLLL